MKRPRIVMVSGNAPPALDGVADSVHSLVRAMVDRRPDWSWSWVSKRPRWFQSPVVFRPGFRQFRPNHAWDETGKRLASGAVRGLRPSIVHVQDQVHSFHESDAAVRIVSGLRVPIVTTLHEYHVELPSVRHTDALVALSDVVIANDSRTADRCVSQAGREPDHRWWSAPGLPDLGSRLAQPTIPGLVATFGFLSGIKGVGSAYDGLCLLRASWPDLAWRIVGPFEPASNPHHSALGEKIRGDWITFAGKVEAPRLPIVLGEASVMLLPFEDGASTRRSTLQAAWALGLPVVTTRSPTSESSLIDGENVLFVRDSTPEGWAEAVGTVLGNPVLADRLRAGSRLAADRFGAARLADLHIALYERLMADRRSAKGTGTA